MTGTLTPSVDKRFATAQAHAMWFYGIRLDALDADDGSPLYVATLHALTRNFRKLPEVEGWLHALDELDAPRHEVARFIGAQERAA
ncbi:MAG: hypothetical protein ABIR54_07130 [Burkholderiaceae bacterium]